MLNVRAFLSHADKERETAGSLKEKLRSYGIDVFVAHDDLEGGTEWMSRLYAEIKECEIFLILVSENYHSSNFTDQELGMALSYEKPIIPICIDSTIPYGFMSKYQCVKASPEFYDVQEVVSIIIKHSEPGQEFVDLLISQLERADSFNAAYKHAVELLTYDKLSKEQASKVLNAYNDNSQIYNSFIARPVMKDILSRNKKQLSKEARDKLKL